MTTTEVLQSLFRQYAMSLMSLAEKHGIGGWLKDIVAKNKDGKCEATEAEVEALSRLVDDERVARADIPKMLGKSYRQCFDDDDFDNIKKLKRVGLYSKVNALLYACKLRNKEENGNQG